MDTARTLVFAVALLGCGGKSSRIQENDGDDDHVGGSSSSQGGRSGSAGSVAIGGNSVGGTAGAGVGGTNSGGTGASGSGGAAGDGCEPGTSTHIVGTVRDPTGSTPLYNVVVYIPLEPLPELSTGISCKPCDLMIPTVFRSALTDLGGNFRVQAPPGENVPLVIQSGKWRRSITVPLVSACVDNVIDDPLRLPRSRSEGNLPRIAVVTGFEDSLECFLRRLGFADSEFTTATGGGAVNLFVGCDGGSGTGADRFASSLGGEPFPDASSLFGDAALLRSYDYVLLGCEGSACESDKSPHHETIEAYANQGGRLILDHHQGYWLKNGSVAWQELASFRNGTSGTISGVTARVDRTYPKGEAFANWLVTTGTSDTLGELLIRAGTSVARVTPKAQSWLYGDLVLDAGPIDIFLLTARTPVNEPEQQQCGRVIFNDFHAMSGAFDSPDLSRSDIPFPDGCISGPLSPQEAAIAFQLFDLPLCIEDEVDPMPPRP